MQVQCLAEALHVGAVTCRGSCDEDDDWGHRDCLISALSSVAPSEHRL